MSILLLFLSQLSAQKETKISYSIFNEYGYYFSPLNIAKKPYSDYSSMNIGYTSVFINNITLNKSMHIGLGVGFEFGSDIEMAVPVFFNFRNYFGNSERKFRPMVNAAVGFRPCINDYYYTDYIMPLPTAKNYLGIYSTMGGGFKAGIFSFHAAYFFKSTRHSYLMGLEMKFGLTF